MSMRWETGLWAFLAAALCGGWLVAGDHPRGCDHCGGCQKVQKVCRVECGKKTISEVKYKVECEDFCTPGPSDKCGCKWIPGCGDVRTKKKLIKYEEKKEVADYKWKVEVLCPACCSACGAMPIPAGGLPATPPAPAPPAPAPTAPAPTAAGKTADLRELEPPVRAAGFAEEAPAFRLR